MSGSNIPETFIGRVNQHSEAHRLAVNRHKNAVPPSRDTELLLLRQKLARLMKTEEDLPHLHIMFTDADGRSQSGKVARYDDVQVRIFVHIKPSGLMMSCKPSAVSHFQAN